MIPLSEDDLRKISSFKAKKLVEHDVCSICCDDIKEKNKVR
jgi:hypothetical protein